MAKERTSKAEGSKKDKEKDKKSKGERHSSADSRVKKSKSKKSSKRAATPPTDDEEESGSVIVEVRPGQPQPEPLQVQDQPGILVPFARPLAGEKLSKKALKTVKKAAKNRSLRRGVKEVVKSLRKSGSTANAIVILAADISPMDVISHIPVLCEDHSVAYMFVTSRAELGAASMTKRPTSVVMLVPTIGEKKKKKKKKGEEEVDAEGEETSDTGYKEAYDELLRLVEAELRGVAV